MEKEKENKLEHNLQPNNTEPAEVVIDITDVVGPTDIEVPTVIVDPKDIIGPIVGLDPTEIVGPMGYVNSTETNKDENSISIDIAEGTRDDLKLTVGYGLVENTKSRDKNINIFTGKQGNTYRTGKVWVFQQQQEGPPREQRPGPYGQYQKYAAPAQGEPLVYEPNRNGFVRKVFLICLCMLMPTFSFTFCCFFTPPLKMFMGTVVALGIFFVCVMISVIVNYIFCCSDCGRIVPCNYIVLFITTGAYCFIVAFIATKYAPFIVMSALFTTILVVLLCLGLAMTSFDFTKFILIVIVASFAMCIATMLALTISLAFGIKLGLVRLALLVGTSVLNCVMLVIEFQMILGGKTVEIGEDDYAYGAYMIYTSIIHLFLDMLRIIDAVVNIQDYL